MASVIMASVISSLVDAVTDVSDAFTDVGDAFKSYSASLSAPSYIVILDAGSSGTRLYVYHALHWTADMKAPPQIRMVFQGTKRGNDGIAKLMLDPEIAKLVLDPKIAPEAVHAALLAAVKTHLEPTIEEAKAEFHKLWHNDETMKKIRLYMLGTAGMRDLSEKPKEFKLLEGAIKTYLGGCGFNVEEGGGYSTITGEEEAAYGWIAANWSLGTFVELKQQSPQKYGYLEMGGASAQIAFLPHKHELTPEQLGDGDMTRVILGGVPLDLFLKTYDLGSDKGWNEYEEELKSIGQKDEKDKVSSSQKGKTIEDPDSPAGRIWWNRDGDEFHGTGNFQSSRFQEKVRRVLNRLTPPQHARGSRLLDEGLIKTLKRRRFVAGANFYYSTRALFGRNIDGTSKQGPFSFSEYDAEVNRTTMLSWPLLKLRLQNKDKIVGTAWFVAAWVKCVLAEGFGLDLVDQSVDSEHELSFRPYHGPKGEELTWTLGKMVQVVAGNQEIKTLSLADITEKHEQAQRAVMKQKAARCEELAWDYLSILCSLPDVKGKDEARARRLEESARAALATAWSMRQAADKFGGKLLNPEEQLAVVVKLRNQISEAAHDGEVKVKKVKDFKKVLLLSPTEQLEFWNIDGVVEVEDLKKVLLEQTIRKFGGGGGNEVHAVIDLRGPSANASPLGVMLTWLYLGIVNDSLKEFAHDADSLGMLEYNFIPHLNGLYVAVNGFNDKMSVLVTAVLEKMKGIVVAADRLEVMKEQAERDLDHFFKEKIYTLSDYYMYRILAGMTPGELQEALRSVNSEELQKHIKLLHSEVQSRTFVLFDFLNPSQEAKIAEMAEGALGSSQDAPALRFRGSQPL